MLRAFQFLGYDPFPNSVETIGEKIKAYRQKQGLSIKKLAIILAVDPSTLTRWEKGEALPSEKLSQKLDTLTQL